MSDNNFSFSQSFIQKLIELTGGAIEPATFDKIINSFQKETEKYFFTQSSEANLIRIFQSVYDKTLFISELSEFPHHIEIITAIAASSNYLTDIVVRNPEYLYQVFDQSYLIQNIDPEILQKEISDGVVSFKSFPAKLNFLRQIKKRITLKIGLTDILGLSDLKSITTQLSILAKAINSKLFSLSFDEIILKYKINYPVSNFCLCSLGKLGGNELNYSSDVDLILFFDKNYYIKEIKKEYQEILAEAALLFIKSSTEITDRGYIYRVDFRLRPDGKFSPLCKTLSDYTRYYETRGEDWERQMLIKLDFVCGSIKLYKQFKDFLQPYIYPSSISSSLKDQIKKMKANIERQNREKDDVKLFAGGIRDIEFSVQALQLLNGGRFKELQSGNSLDAIQKLCSKNLLKKNEKDIFTEAYIFYRRVEHFLQLMNDTQTHVIPTDGELLNKLANYLGFNSSSDFKLKLTQYRKSVRDIYNEILYSGESVAELTSGINFIDKSKADKNLVYLRNGLGISGQKEFDARTINLFTSIEPTLINYLRRSEYPDRVLENFVKVIRSAVFQSIWYNEFSNLKFFERFLELCERSQKAVDLLSTDKMLEEFFLSRRVFIKNAKSELNNFTTNQIILLAAVQFALGLIDTEKVSAIIGNYVSHKIRNTLNELELDYVYFVGALGSCGSGSMNFASDIDLIIVADDVNKYKTIQEDFQKFVRIIQKELKPFEVDFRLRPEGNKSPLVVDINNYENYFRERARTWEFQSLLKLSFVCGNKNLFYKFKKILTRRVGLLDASSIVKEIKQMIGNVQKEFASNGLFNLKKEKGGLQSIDFITQSIALSNVQDFKKCSGKSISKMIKYMIKNGYEDFEELNRNYKALRKIEFTIQNLFNKNSAAIPSAKDQKELLEKNLGLREPVENYISSIVKSTNKFLDKYLE